MRATLFYILLWSLFAVGCVASLSESTQEVSIGDGADSGGSDTLGPRCWIGDGDLYCCGGDPFRCFVCYEGGCSLVPSWTSGGRTCCIVDGVTVCDGQTFAAANVATERELRALCECYGDYYWCCQAPLGELCEPSNSCRPPECQGPGGCPSLENAPDEQALAADVLDLRACYSDGFCCSVFDNGDYLCCRNVSNGTTCYTSL